LAIVRGAEVTAGLFERAGAPHVEILDRLQQLQVMPERRLINEPASVDGGQRLT
jgi:hypothetical protein